MKRLAIIMLCCINIVITNAQSINYNFCRGFWREQLDEMPGLFCWIFNKDGTGHALGAFDAPLKWSRVSQNKISYSYNQDGKIYKGQIFFSSDTTGFVIDSEGYKNNIIHKESSNCALIKARKEFAAGDRDDPWPDINLIKNCAENGDEESQMFLANYYLHKDNLEEAFLWWIRAAMVHKNKDAIHYIQIAVEQDFEAAKIALEMLKNKDYEILSIPELHILADNGDVKAQQYLGYYYAEGKNNVAQNYEEAAKWFRKAAEQDDVFSQTMIGLFYFNGNGVQKNYSESIKWLRKAAEKGDDLAQFALGACYYDGKGVSQNYIEAINLFRKSAEQDYIFAQYHLGNCYEKGIGVTPNKAEAIKWYRKAAEQGHAEAKRALERLDKRDYSAMSVSELGDLANNGNPAAQYNLGRLYMIGKGVTIDKNKGIEWYRKAADQGYVDAQNALASCYKKGVGVAKNINEAIKWYRKAAEAGNHVAQVELGRCYKYGIGVSKNVNEAVDWFRKSAEQENIQAYCELGYCYEEGEDYVHAFNWFTKAAEQGHQTAQSRLGYYYEEGKGVSKDYTKAENWYRKAAEQGDTYAQIRLGVLLKSGNGVTKDDAEAEKWFSKAAEQDKSQYTNIQSKSLRELITSPMGLDGCTFISTPISTIKQKMEAVYKVDDRSKDETATYWIWGHQNSVAINYIDMKFDAFAISQSVKSMSYTYLFELKIWEDPYEKLDIIISDFKNLGIPLEYERRNEEYTKAKGRIEVDGIAYNIKLTEYNTTWEISLRVYYYFQ